MAEILTYIFIYWLVGWVSIVAIERWESGKITVRELFEMIPYALIWIIIAPCMLWSLAESRGWLDKKVF